MEKTNPAAKRRRNASASARRSAGGSTTATTGSGEAEKNKPPSTTSVATTSLLGIAAVQRVFHFLDGPAEVLRAASASHRWYELATADSVWRAKAVREGMVEKARVFEVALPEAAATADCDGGSGMSSSSSLTSMEEDELAGVGLSFYAQIYVLKVPTAQLMDLMLAIVRMVLTLLPFAVLTTTTYARPRCRSRPPAPTSPTASAGA